MSKTNTEFCIAFREHPGAKPLLFEKIYKTYDEAKQRIAIRGDNGKKYYSIFMRETTDWRETIPEKT